VLLFIVMVVIILSPYQRLYLLICASLPQNPINLAVLGFWTVLRECLKASRRHFEHLL